MLAADKIYLNRKQYIELKNFWLKQGKNKEENSVQKFLKIPLLMMVLRNLRKDYLQYMKIKLILG